MHHNFNNNIMKKTSMILAALSVIIGLSCTNIGYKKTKTGLEYKIFPGGGTQVLKKGDYVKFDYKIVHVGKDSVIASSYGQVPGYDMVDSITRPHDFSEFLKEMKVGDSAVCIQLYDSLVKGNPYAAPPYLKKGDKQKITIKILAAITGGREPAFADYQQEIEKYKQKEVEVIAKYIAQNSIKAEKTVSGVFVEVQDKGTGPAADSGKVVSIKYTGYNFAGKFFDSNMDTTKQIMKHGLEPYSFVAKQQGAIPGMLEGITAFNQGGKGRLFIPAMMAYGPQGSPPAIGPNENLIFDIEVVEVKDMPKQPVAPGAMVQPVDTGKTDNPKKKK